MIFGKKKENTKNRNFILGVSDIFRLKDSEDMVIIGNVSGTVNVGDTVSIINFGDDNAQTFSAEVCEIEHNKQKAASVTDSLAALRIKNGNKYNLKTGTVIYSGNYEVQDIYNNYAVAFITQMDVLGFQEKTVIKASLSECAEIVRIDNLLASRKNAKKTSEETVKQRSLINAVIKEKLLDSEYVYCVYSKHTGEPYMKSAVYKNDDGLSAEPPVIILITESFLSFAKIKFPVEEFDMRKIENGNDKNGIEKFLGFNFYINGAAGVSLLYDDVIVPGQLLISKDEYDKKYPLPLPVANPEIQALMLLIHQIGDAKNDDEKIILNFYYKLIANRMDEAVFLVPAGANEKEEAKESPDIPVVKTGDDRYAVPLFTDVLHMVAFFGNKYDAIANKAAAFTEDHDIIINPSDINQQGCYFSKEMIEQLK